MNDDLRRTSAYLDIVNSLLGIALGLSALLPVVLTWFGLLPRLELKAPSIVLPIDLTGIFFELRVLVAFSLVFLFSWSLTFLSVRAAATKTPEGHLLSGLIVGLAAIVACSTIFTIGYNSAPAEPSKLALPWACLIGFLIFNISASGHYRKTSDSDAKILAFFNTAFFSALGFWAAYSGISSLEAQAKQSVQLEQQKARFLDCPTLGASEIRTTYPEMSTASLYCWAWHTLPDLGGDPGVLAYSARLVKPKTDLLLRQGDCVATGEDDFFVAGRQIRSGIAVSPNSDYAIIGCRTYSSIFRPYHAARNKVTTEWRLTLVTEGQQMQSPTLISCVCDELRIAHATFDSSTSQVTLDLTTTSDVRISGKLLRMYPYGPRRIVLSLTKELVVQTITLLE